MLRAITSILLYLLARPVVAQVDVISPEMESNIVTITAPGRVVKIPYLDLRKFQDRFRNSRPGPQFVESRLTLAVGTADPDFVLYYSDQAGTKKQVIVDKYRIVHLPDLAPEIGRTTVLTARVPEKSTSYMVSVVYIPRLSSKVALSSEEYLRLLAETDLAFKMVPWSTRLLFAGKMNAKASGIKFCFADSNSALKVGSQRFTVGEKACYSHRIDDAFVKEKLSINFEGELVHAEIILGS